MLENSNHNIDDLLIKYLLGEATPGEQIEVEAWLNADTKNRKLYQEYQLIWQESRHLLTDMHTDKVQAWHRMKQRMVTHNPDRPLVRSRRFRLSGMAAVWILLIAGTALIGVYYFRNQPAAQVVVQSGRAVLRDTLPDGSIVTLNKESLVSYPEKFRGNKREVRLLGEGFFNITPDKNKPFIIKTGDLQIKVVGTSFNVRTVNGNTEVIVETGIVEVSRRSQTVKLAPKEKVVVKEKDVELVKETVQDKLYNYYASREFVCVNTPLWKLVDILNEAYDVHIVIAKKESRRLPLTTTFNNESLEQILDVISQTFNISVDRAGDSIILN